MATRLYLQEITNVDLGRRNLFVHPPEPPLHMLFDDPTNGIYVGRTEALNVPFYWNYKDLVNPHIAIVGITGSGKSYFIKTFLLRASFVWNSNAVIIDWAGEYKDWVLESGGKVISLGAGNYLNLLDLGGMRPFERIKQIMRSLEILTDIKQYPEQERLTEEAIEKAYLNAKFKMDRVEQRDELGVPLEPPTFKDVVKVLEEKQRLGNYPYPAELDNAIHRLKEFTRPGQDFFANKSTISLDEIVNSGLVDIDLTSLPDENYRALAALTLLQFIKEKMRREGLKQKKEGLRLITVLDEAWKISKDENSDAVMIVREGRKYNFSLIIASQNPTDISQVIFSNVGTTFILKTKFENFLDYLQGSLNFSDYIRDKIVNFGVGQAAVNLAFHTPERVPSTFIIKKIEGEEPVKDYYIDMSKVIKGENMAKTLSLSKIEFKKKMRMLGLSESNVEALSNLFEKNGRRMDVVTLVITLENFGINRRNIASFLKDFGVDDSTMINIFSKVDLRKEGAKTGISKLVLEDE